MTRAVARAQDVGLGLSTLTLAGVSVSHLDIAPRHAGAVFGLGNTFATLAGAPQPQQALSLHNSSSPRPCA